MKKTTIFFLALLCRYAATAQSTDSFTYIFLADTTAFSYCYTTYAGNVVPVFTDASVNSILDDYTFTAFQQAYPSSRYQYLRKIYKVAANSSAFAPALKSRFPYLFPWYQTKAGVALNADTYYPNDFWDNTHTSVYNDNLENTYTWYLDYIYAPEAWAITKGSSSMVIGITDNGFFVEGAAGTEGNPDLNSKALVVEDNSGFPSSDEPAHGTMTAGIAAGATDNGSGYPSIGFNCMLDLAPRSDYWNLFLSGTQQRKVINASWQDNIEDDTVNWYNDAAQQLVYNEIYENGTSMCFAAGNSGTPWKYQYPSSLNHNISTTNVMGENCPWASGGACDSPCNCDQHDIYAGDTMADFHHNLRVDLCAPAVRVGGLTYDTSYSVGDPSRYYQHDAGWGTSFASPLVAGTVGLMLSVNPNLSPYQVEYILKESSRNIYDTAANNYLFNIDRFHSRAGAGALDAGKAVAFSNWPAAGSLDPNDTATQTFMVDGIEFNTICVPGYASNGALPKLIPIMENGTAPYTYQWAPLADNNATLDNIEGATPTIVSADSPFLADFLLTVYDNSQIQKVADKEIRIQLQADNNYTLGMRDSYMDMMDQPNSQALVDPYDWNIWLSPDIWNRQAADSDTIPQNIAYYPGLENYMYTRVRNVGCADYTNSGNAQLHTYWTLGSTGENWSVDWTTAQVLGADSILQPGGGEITTASSGIAIPTMHPGDQFISSTGWYPKNPTVYTMSPTSVEQCGLARIVEPYKANNGMGFPEGSNVNTNVNNNRYIVTRNMTDVKLEHYPRYAGPPSPVITRIYVGNVSAATQTFSLQLLTDRDTYKQMAGNLSEDIYVSLQLQPELYTAWQSGGGIGNYASADPNTYTVTYDPNVPLRLDSISMDSGAKYFVNVSFIVRDNPIGMPANQKMHFRQLTSTGQIYGNYSFSVHIAADSPQAKGVLAVTEISNGPSADCEYAEMIVANCGADTSNLVDISGWIVDDNSGNFNVNGCMDGVGITKGHYRLPETPMWRNVPVGSIIVIYNHDNNCYNLADTFTVDTTAGKLVYWMPVGGTETNPYGDPHLQRFNADPVNSDCVYCASDTSGAGSSQPNVYKKASAWVNTVGLNDNHDAFQVRCPGCSAANPGEPSFYHGIGYSETHGHDAFASIAAGTNDLGGAVVKSNGEGNKFVFSGSTANDLGDENKWATVPADMTGVPPLGLGSVSTGFMNAVTSHSLGLPCCEKGSQQRRAQNNTQTTTKGSAIQDITVYPNPANSTLYFQFPASPTTTIKMMNISGQLIGQQVIYGGTMATFDVSGYMQGLYLYQVVGKDKTQSGKVMVE